MNKDRTEIFKALIKHPETDVNLGQKNGFNPLMRACENGFVEMVNTLVLHKSIQINEKDEVFEDKGVKILVDRKSLLYLLGTSLDFSDGLNGKGFQFVNPNASRTCGCGESFSV